ncbi:hypothetical protein scyTo_0017513, partial [Scyliorhinus torazame]|nr:hypothetical protein [Scyliorhinus torazame]
MASLSLLFLALALFPHGIHSCDHHSMQILETGNTREITINYTVVYGLSCTSSCSHSLCLTVPEGTGVHQIMKLAEDKDPIFLKSNKTASDTEALSQATGNSGGRCVEVFGLASDLLESVLSIGTPGRIRVNRRF